MKFYQSLWFNLFIASISSLLCQTGCVKDTSPNNVPYRNYQFDPAYFITGYTPEIPIDAAGAFYELYNVIAVDTGEVLFHGINRDSSQTSTALCWFGNKINAVPAGDVTCFGKTLSRFQFDNGAYVNILWYHLSDSTNTLFSGNNITWQVTGNNYVHIPSFTYQDTSSPPLVNFMLPDTLNSHDILNIKSTVAGKFDYLGLKLSSNISYYGSSIIKFSNPDSIIITPTILHETGNYISVNPYSSSNLLVVTVTVIASHTSTFIIDNKTYYIIRECSTIKNMIVTP